MGQSSSIAFLIKSKLIKLQCMELGHRQETQMFPIMCFLQRNTALCLMPQHEACSCSVSYGFSLSLCLVSSIGEKAASECALRDAGSPEQGWLSRWKTKPPIPKTVELPFNPHPGALETRKEQFLKG